MAAAIDNNLIQFDLWETITDDSIEMTTEFWLQCQLEADRLEMDLVPPADLDSLSADDPDWRIMETQQQEEEEEPEEHKENIVHHDCMWAGSCVDSVHPTNTFIPSELIRAPTPAPGQSLLRRDMSPNRPDTPPSMDGDEPPQFRHTVDVVGTAQRLLRDSAAVAADHSYTLARQQFDGLGVQTPSDSGESEEEIDVVSLGTSQPLAASSHVRTDTLPRVPSAQERQHIQRTVESAMAPRPAARKRLVPPPAPRRRARGPGRRPRRANTDTDSEAEAPEMERRSIHNDMERLRRIGLKNLFDELKKQIPATKDKDRAPKVVILREAASLCRRLREDEIVRENLKKQQSKLLARLKKLRALVAARYRPY